MKQLPCALTGFGFASIAALALTPNATAQIVPDGTLGPESSRLVSDQLIRGALGDRIDGGAVRGSALFHSFEQFNVGELQRVYFSNPAAIDAILSRVTGNDVSDIMGTLGVDGGASLFFLNPNGIVFGENARLDVSGSFLASTSDRFTFSDGSIFSATDPQAPPLLTVNAPVGLQLGAETAGNITSDGVLYAGQDLTLEANNLDLEGQLWAGGDLSLLADSTLRIRDRIDAPFVAAAQGKLLAQGNQAVDIFALNNPESGLWSGGDMTLRSAAAVGGDAHYQSGGNFRIEALDESLGELESPNDPVIYAQGDVSFNGYAGASLHILATGSVTIPGFIQILEPDAETGLVDNAFRLSNSASFPINGQAEPTVDIRAGVDPEFIAAQPAPPLPATGFFNPALTPIAPNIDPAPVERADITVGTILFGDILPDGEEADLGTISQEFQAGRVLLTNRFSPDPLNPIPGNIQIRDTLPEVASGQLNGVAIRTNTFRGGGTVAIDSRGGISLRGAISAEAIPLNFEAVNEDATVAPEYLNLGTAFPRGGNVTLLANGNIVLEAGEMGRVTGINSAGEVGGNVTLQAGNSVLLRPFSGISSNSANNNNPSFSTIRLNALTGSVRLDRAFVLAENAGSRFSGDIFLDAGDRVDILNGSNVSARGVFGRVFVGRDSNTSTLLLDDSRILAANDINDATRAGRAGDIFIQANEVVAQRSQRMTTLIAADTFGAGAGGDIEIRAQSLRILEGAEILTRTFGAGTGGDITILPQNPAAASTVTISGVAPFTRLDPVLDPNGNPVIAVDGGPALSPDGGFSSGLFATTEDGATGDGGSVTIGTPQARINTLNITDRGVVSARTRSLGDSQDITVNVNNLNIESGGQILTASVLLNPEAAPASGTSQAGNITIDASERIRITGYNAAFLPSLSALEDAFEAAGLDELTAFQRARQTVDPISASSGIQASDVFGFGAPGSILIESPAIELSNLAGIDATTRGNNDGPGIVVRAQNLSLTGGAEITSLTRRGFAAQPGTLPTGRAGDITIEPLNPGRPSSVFISGVAPSRLPDGEPGGFSSGLFSSTESDTLPDGTVLQTLGAGGNISITTTNLAIRDGGVVGVRTRSEGDGGNVAIVTNDLTIVGGGQILSASFGEGDAGNIAIAARGSIDIRGTDPELGARLRSVFELFTAQVNAQNEEAGTVSNPETVSEVALERTLFSVDLVPGSTPAESTPEPITVESINDINFVGDTVAPSGLQARSNLSDSAEVPESSRSGNIYVSGRRVTIADGAEINSEQRNSNSDVSNRSFVGIAATRGSLNIDDARVVTTNSGTGLAGIVFVSAPENVRIRNQARVLSNGNLGTVLIGETLELANLEQLIPERIVVGSGSRVRTDNGNAEFAAGIFSDSQQAGQVLLRANDRITVRGLSTRISSDTSSQADAGQVAFRADTIDIQGSQTEPGTPQISSSTFGQGQAGSIDLEGDTISIRDGAVLFSTVEAGARGNGGEVRITGRRFSVSNGAQIQTSVKGPEGGRRAGFGNAGDIIIDASESVVLDNSVALFSDIGPEVIGSRNRPNGQGGNIFVGDVIDSPNGDRIIIRPTPTFSATNGSQIITSTSGRQGTVAGNAFVIADDVSFRGENDDGFPSAIFSGVDLGGRGRGGNVLVIGGVVIEDGDVATTRPSSRLDVSEGAVITVSSFGREDIGGESDRDQILRAGNILASARFVNLFDDGDITARTGTGNGGNIRLTDVDQLVFLRQDSRISTTAGTAQLSGNGGNIEILADGGFVVGETFGNDDITSDAFLGRGGQIDITADGIINLIFRSRDDLEQELGEGAFDDPDPADRLPTSDITAISQSDPLLNGEVRVNAIDFNVSSITELPSDLVDGADLVTQACPSGPGASDRLGDFVITGRGGLPPAPSEALDLGDLLPPWDSGSGADAEPEPPTGAPEPLERSTEPGTPEILQADGWQVDDSGSVVLVASANISGQDITPTPAGCP